MEKAPILSVDTETNGEDIRDGRGFCMGVSLAGKVNGEIVKVYLPFRHITGGNLDRGVLAYLKTVLESGKPLVFHNAKFDIVSLSTLGIDVSEMPWFCTMILIHLLNENLWSKSLNSCADHYLEGGLRKSLKDAELEIKRAKRRQDDKAVLRFTQQAEMIKSQMGTFHKDMSEDLSKWIKTLGWATIPVELMTPYAEQDAVLPLELLKKIWPLLEEENLFGIWEHKKEITRVLIAMEGRGIRIDRDVCEQEASTGEVRMAEIIKELNGFSPASTTDLKVLLLDTLHLPVFKTTPAGKPSFDKTAMELYDLELQFVDSPIAKLILEFRGWQKSVSSNYKPYISLMSPDGRLRPNYKMHGTKTGRLSCEKPNLQQIPKVSDKAWNGRMKSAFIPREGYTLVEADYSQLELRLTAVYSKEPALIEIFNTDRDIFTEMAAALSLSRYDTKQFVYSTQYGAGIRRIKQALGITEKKAQEIRANYHDTYPRVKALSDSLAYVAKSAGKIKLWSGRWRHFYNPEKEAHKALNSLMQGGGADIVERQMVRLYNLVDQQSNGECQMLLQVHDSVVFEIKNGTEDKYLPMIKAVMEDMEALVADVEDTTFGVKFKVDIHKWGTEASWVSEVEEWLTKEEMANA